MRAIEPQTAVYVYTGAFDMRCGFDRLSEWVRTRLNRAVTAGGLFVFISRDRARVKILYWDMDGYALWHKRLEAGVFRVEWQDGVEELTGIDLTELLRGVDLARIRFQKKLTQSSCAGDRG